MKLVHQRNLPYLSYFSKIKNIFLITSRNKLSELTNCSNYTNYSKLDGHTNPVILKSSRFFEKIRIYYNTNQKVLTQVTFILHIITHQHQLKMIMHNMQQQVLFFFPFIYIYIRRRAIMLYALDGTNYILHVLGVATHISSNKSLRQTMGASGRYKTPISKDQAYETNQYFFY